MKTKYWLIVCVAVAVIAFLAGRQTVPTKEVIRYVKGETTTNYIRVPYPVVEYVPSDPKLIYRDRIVYKDTGYVVVREVDSAAILKDYITERTYAFNMYKDEYGTLDVDSLKIQYNALQKFQYTRTPIMKERVIFKEPLFTPWVTAGYNTFEQVNAGAGLYYKNVGVGYNYIHDTKTGESAHGISLNIKF